MTNAVTFGHKALNRAVCHGISTGFSPTSCLRAAAGRRLQKAAKEANMLRTFTIALTLAVATPVFALEPINQNAVIRDKLLQGFIGDAIADNCPTIKARTIKALGELNNLRDYALEQGYEASVVREFVTSDAEKAKFKAEAAEWLKAKGAEPGNPEAYCKIGEDEIAKGTLAGSLLRSTK
jgi:TPR repeat protein